MTIDFISLYSILINNFTMRAKNHNVTLFYWVKLTQPILHNKATVCTRLVLHILTFFTRMMRKNKLHPCKFKNPNVTPK